MYGLFLIVNVNMKTKDISLLTCKKGMVKSTWKKMHYDCTNFQVKSSQSRAATKLAREGYAQYWHQILLERTSILISRTFGTRNNEVKINFDFKDSEITNQFGDIKVKRGSQGRTSVVNIISDRRSISLNIICDQK